MISLPSEEEIMIQFPHVVQHDARFASVKWRQMAKWLRESVGAPEQTWTWLVSSHLRFKHESDVVQFRLTWS